MGIFLKKISSIILLLLFLINSFYYSVNAEVIFFDLKNNGANQLLKYKDYRKCKGLIQAYIYGLSVVPIGFVVNSHLSSKDILEIKMRIGDLALCRPDAPTHQWYGLPRGRDLKIDDINEFLTQCRKINLSSVLLCFSHPSTYFTGENVARYDLSGACNVVIDWDKIISIDFVGNGYDCGELSRGKNSPHSTIDIPWYLSDWPPSSIWNNSMVKHIERYKYEQSRQQRIETLVEMGYDKATVEEKIPIVPNMLDKRLFCNIFDNCVKKIIKHRSGFEPKIPLMILINIYGDKLHVFEMWASNS